MLDRGIALAFRLHTVHIRRRVWHAFSGMSVLGGEVEQFLRLPRLVSTSAVTLASSS